MYDLELMRRVSVIGQLSELEQAQIREYREFDPEAAPGNLEASSPFDEWTGEQITRLISPEAENLVVNFEVTSRDVYERRYIKPIWPGGASGVTIGIGYDLGYHPPSEIAAHWKGLLSDADIALLQTAFRLTGPTGKAALSRFASIRVPWDAALSAYRRSTMPKYGRLVLGAFPNANSLHGHSFGALFSLVFNRGASMDASDRRKEMREIRAIMSEKNFKAVPERILAMRRIWANANLPGLLKRRELEAALFARGVELSEISIADATKASAWTPVVAASDALGGSGGPTLERVADAGLESADELARRDGDGLDYSEDEDTVAQLERARDWDAVKWVSSDDDAPDYNHILDRSLTGKTFQFGWRELELLLRANAFEPIREHGRIVFGLRGARVVTSLTDPSPMTQQEDRDTLTLQDVRPDHADFRCVLGVYNLATRRVSGFASSTVPNRKAVFTFYSKKTSGNMMPTGCYRFEVGWHLASKPDRRIPGCLIENGRQKAVLRSPSNPVYDLPDDWENHRLHGDNLHPAKSEQSARFSSWGCLVVKGNYVVSGSDRAKGQHTEEWAHFRKAMGWAPTGTGDHGKQYDVVLFTGLEGAIANGLIGTGQDADPSVVRDRLQRLRQGSRGESVVRLQKSLGVAETGILDHVTAKALADRQKATTNGRATGIYSPAIDDKTGWGVFAPETPSDSLIVASATSPSQGSRLENQQAAVFEAASKDDRLAQLYYEIGAMAATAQSAGGSLESAAYESFGDAQLEWGFSGFSSLGHSIAKVCEDKLREIICGAGTIDRVVGDEVRQTINDYSKRGTDAIRAILIETLSKTIGLPLPRTVIEKAVDVVIEKVLFPLAGPAGTKAMDGINITTQMMCQQWSKTGGITGGVPSPAIPHSDPGSQPASVLQDTVAAPVEQQPPVRAPLTLIAQSRPHRARDILVTIEAAAHGPSPDIAGVRRYVTELRDHLAGSGEELSTDDNKRLLDVLVNTRLLDQVVGTSGPDPYSLMRAVENVLMEKPNNTAAFDEALCAVNAVLSDARMRIQPEAVKTFLKALRSAKKFEALSVMADRFVTRDPGLLGVVATAYAQGLVDSGRILAAIQILDNATPCDGVSEKDLPDADGVRGRAHKQIYVNFVRSTSDAVVLKDSHSDHLRASIESYKKHYRPDNVKDTYYHGINYITLLKRAERDRIKIEAEQPASELATHFIAQLEPAAVQDNDAWLLASIGEAYLTTGHVDKAAEFFGRYAQHPGADAFALSGTIRQLKEVWQIVPGQTGEGAIVTRLMATLAQKENGELILDPVEQQALMGIKKLDYQTQFETYIPGGTDVGFAYMFRMVMSGAAVAGMYVDQTPLAQPIGTGFLVKGTDLHPSLTDERSYLLTNAHVMWCPMKGQGTVDGALPPDRARIMFDSDIELGRKRLLKCANVIWQSPVDEHDACLIALDSKIPESEIQPLRVTKAALELKVSDDHTKSTPLAVVGHPNRNKLTIRFRGGLLDQHGTLVDKGPRKGKKKPEYLHYKTQTEPGNSGSPVFETEGWSIVALHHSGPKVLEMGLPKLGEKDGSNAANEGIWIESIREGIAEALQPPPPVQEKAAKQLKPAGWWKRN